MNKQIKDYKWIIGTGCSYGRMLDSIKSPFVDEKMLEELGTDVYEFNDSIIGINLSVGSQGSAWQSDSIIHVCNELLKKGIPSDNIYCFIEWSQWSRVSIPLPQYMNLDINQLNIKATFKDAAVNDIGMFLIEDNNTKVHINDFIDDVGGLSDLLSNIKIGMSYSNGAPYNISHINNFVYLSPNHTDINQTSDYAGVEFGYWVEESQKIENLLSTESKIDTYLNNILKTQWFLKSNNIKYNCVHMQADFTGWTIRTDGLAYHEITHGDLDSYINPYYNKTELDIVKNPNFKKSTIDNDIEVVFPEISHKFNMIDFSNFWYHESDNFRRGGIDEWAMDVYKEGAYSQLSTKNPITKEDFESILNRRKISYGLHPTLILYMLLWNETSTNCNFLKIKFNHIQLIDKMYWEDYNSEKFTEHGISMSYKFWNSYNKKSI